MGSQGFRSRCGITTGYILTAMSRESPSQTYQAMYPIGLGSNGEVWKASRVDTDDDCIVVKFFAPVQKNPDFVVTEEIETDPERIARLRLRFIKECEAVRDAPQETVNRFRGLSLLSNPPYFCLEYRKGLPLSRLIRKNTLSRKNRLFLFNEICKSVARLHQVMLHLDLKPSNIMVHDSGKVSLIDLGSSIRNEEIRLFKRGKESIAHTWCYAAPEVRSLQTISKAADVYSLGCILFEMLSGVRLDLSNLSSSNLAPQMLDVIKTATEPDIRKRFQNVLALRKAFLDAVKGTG